MIQKRVTVVDIARAAGVSKSTVSLVLQNSPLVNEATRVKVTAVIRELGYVYNRGAANLRQSNAKSKIIGIVVNDLTNSFFAELAVGVDLVVQSAGYVQFLSNTGESLDRQREVVSSMREHGISGLIISPARGTDAADLKPLVASGIPVVMTVRNVAGAKVSSLMSDNHGGAFAAVEHLLALGHRRIAFLGGFADTGVYAERYQGYKDALQKAGIAVEERLAIGSAPSRAGGVDAIGRALLLERSPTAALCFNDAVAFGVCDGLRARRTEPGADFAVIGFDDVIEAKTAVPALTTVSVDPQGMGQKAAQLLLRQINAGQADAEAIVSSVRLVVRESCGAGLNNGARRVAE
ncbi:LacI family DNA-binding transcriptional regulator [Pseudochrobactrum sp. sp1633]|uniref:LacI family DNA-binding transcriptional regulator n=1 Tax=Pseudochrobactrum sp. sp1633 TaxID=3036706 RepID=UPI0025A5278E|nr:LacI family DNA-binding transcriptional regulator [Pseudochrobactrum sp. sp1633]MDM8344050.1 LacI family DNA-binding transcriptional regulator [Pseudochrobactrum sp. sp1633]HWD12023.1 LacI family DNA-binding transcriptional regulator [Pseudochrobactrum sp.]